MVSIILFIIIIVFLFFIIKQFAKTSKIDLSDVQQGQEKITASEYILAVGLVIFLLIGGVRILSLLGNIPHEPQWSEFEAIYHLLKIQKKITPVQNEMIQIQNMHNKTTNEFEEINKKYIFQREHYRIMSETGEKSDKEKRDYLESKKLYLKTQKRLDAIKNRLDEVKAKLNDPLNELQEKRKVAEKAFKKADTLYQSKCLFLRLLFALPLVLISIFLFQKSKKSGSSHTIVAGSVMIFSIIQSIVLVFQYSFSIFEGMVEIIVSIFGSAGCIMGMTYIKNHIFNAEQTSKVRFTKRKCPGCSFPFKDDSFFCQHCGMKLAEKCPDCGNTRFVITRFCSSCGAEIRKA